MAAAAAAARPTLVIRELNGVKLLARVVHGVAPKDLRGLIDDAKKQLGSGIAAIVGVSEEGKAGLVVGVTADLIGRYDAVELARIGAEALGGKGGRRAPRPRASRRRRRRTRRAGARGDRGEDCRRGRFGRGRGKAPRGKRLGHARDDAWRRWRRKVHDILEVGGDAHPAGRLVNGFIVTLIVLNAIAFAAETVDALAARYGP